MTRAEIENIAGLFRAAGRTKIPISIDEWVTLMLAKIEREAAQNGRTEPRP